MQDTDTVYRVDNATFHSGFTQGSRYDEYQCIDYKCKQLEITKSEVNMAPEDKDCIISSNKIENCAIDGKSQTISAKTIQGKVNIVFGPQTQTTIVERTEVPAGPPPETWVNSHNMATFFGIALMLTIISVLLYERSSAYTSKTAKFMFKDMSKIAFIPAAIIFVIELGYIIINSKVWTYFGA